MDAKEFWAQFDTSNREHEKWEKRAQKVIDRYRQDKGSQTATFNILWANTEVLRPTLFSQVPHPDIRRRYPDRDAPDVRQGVEVLTKCLQFVMDDGDNGDEGDFYTFGDRSVMDYLLPGRTAAKVRYVPTVVKTTKRNSVVEQPILSPLGEDIGTRFMVNGEEVDEDSVQRDERGMPFTEESVDEVVDERVLIERWPWKNFRHQKAKRWADVGWVDYISFLDRDQLKKLFGNKKGEEITLTVNSSGEGDHTEERPTHAEVHEVWFKRTREVKIGVRGMEDDWLKEGDDPLNLVGFYPTPRPVMPINTNDSLAPIPLFTLYQHQANELDTITRRISNLMKSLKMVGLYAGNEKDTLKRLFEGDENQMVPVADWSTIAQAGGVAKLVDYLPIDQVGKVLSALFVEREKIVRQIFELTGIGDIQRGVSDPRETKGAQVLKAQFGSQRSITPKQEIERYFRDTIRIAAEIISEHFSGETIARMTGEQLSPEVMAVLRDDMLRSYSIDIETDSTVVPDEARDKAEMAEALNAVSGYLGAVFPMAQAGVSPQPLLQLLKVYLRKFKWGREMEEMLEEAERQPPPPPQPDPEMMKAQAEMQQMQAEFQMDMQAKQADLQRKQQEAQIDMQIKMLDLQIAQQEAQQDLTQDQQQHLQEMTQKREEGRLKLEQIRAEGDAKADAARAQAAATQESDSS